MNRSFSQAATLAFAARALHAGGRAMRRLAARLESRARQLARPRLGLVEKRYARGLMATYGKLD